MPPALALFVWLVLIVLLLRYDPATDRRTSPALLLALIWMLIRPPENCGSGNFVTPCARMQRDSQLMGEHLTGMGI